jgi:transcription elongation GreA/GreB family factor
MSNPDTSCMLVDALPGDRVEIGSVVLELVQKSGRYSRFRIVAPREMPIKRIAARANAVAVPSMAHCNPD